MEPQEDTHVHKLVNTNPASRRILGVCDAVGDFIAYWGFKAIHGRVWTFLALHRAPVTQAAVARGLGVSRSLVSGTMADLQAWGLVRPVDDDRHTPYVAVVDVWPTISDVLRSREWMLIESTRLALEAALEAIDRAEREGECVPYDASRIRQLLSMTEVAQTFLRLLMRMRHAPIEGFGQWVNRATGMLKLFRN